MSAVAASFDAVAFKAAQREQWDRSAAGWDAHGPQIRMWLRTATDAMIEMAGVRPGSRVLDVAAGAGDQTLDLAERVGPQGVVLATDLSPALVARTRGNAERAGHAQVAAQVGDAEHLPVDSGTFDAAVCRLGLMFLPDPLQGLREMHRALRPGGGVCTVVFSRPERNPCVATLLGTALKHASLPPRDPYAPGGLLSLGKPGRVDELFRQAGFEHVATTTLDAPFELPSVRHYLDFVRSSASPVQQILGRLGAAAAEAAWADIEEKLSVFQRGGRWVGPNELLVTAGRRPG
jgi:SAM-dependent methyltransferase